MLDEFRSTHITWDKATRRIYSPITANASDSNGRKLNIQVVNSGQVKNLTGATLHLYWETKDKVHDGLDTFTASDISKGEFEIFYTTGMLSNVGELNATLVLVDSTGKVVSDWFKITVTRGINEGAIQSENSFSSLTQALIDISNLEQNYAPRLNDLTAQLQQTYYEATRKKELEDLSPSVLSAIDGSGGPFNLLSKPQRNSVGVIETEYPMAEGVPSKNIFTGWERGGFSWTDGSKTNANNKLRTRGMMRVNPNEYIWIDDPDSDGTLKANAQYLFEYDKSGVFIKYVNINVFTSRGYLPSANCYGINLMSQTEGAGDYVIGDFESYKTQVEYGMAFTGYETPFPKTKLPEFKNLKTVDLTYDFTDKTITSAINNSDDSVDNPITIRINPGIYEESVFVGGSRHLSLIGENKKDCIIKTKTGLYADAPLEISGDVYVANLSLIAEFVTPPSDVNAQTAYGLHVDYSGEGVAVFENLYVKSSLTSALGLGTKNNQKLIFRNCVFESEAPENLNYAKYGAAFLHSSTSSEHTNQRVEFHSCVFRSKNNTVMWISDVNGTSEIEIGFYNNLFWSEVSGKNDSVVAIYGSKVKITPDSYGNNVAKLNK